jgi:hypothetical protein
MGRHENRDLPTHHLLGRVAVETLGCLVPEYDRPANGLADDGIVGRPDQGCQEGLVI